AIACSAAYPTLVGPDTLRPDHIASLMRSDKVGAETKSSVVRRLRDFTNAPKDGFQATAQYALWSRAALEPADIDLVRAGGADTASVIALLAQGGDQVPTADLQHQLREIGRPYSPVADRGGQRTRLPASDEIRSILRRLQNADIVESFRTTRNGEISVKTAPG
ncbi:MAG: hypothetical protein FWE61_08085, partial [Micrococcales bacterium]|nr:hypothetical protein [Micrococcales bacterium]